MTITDQVTRTFDGLASRIDATGLRSVGFTSALLGEGVSTIALGTALALAAQRHDTLLLIDANWIQPSLSADADLESAPGLADYLASKADLATVIRSAPRSRPAFLPVGDRSAARPTLRSLAALLANDVVPFQTVLVDLPPILGGEHFVLPWATLLDQLFVVLREGATPLPLAREALAKISLATSPYVVLNRTTAPSPELAMSRLAPRTSRL